MRTPWLVPIVVLVWLQAMVMPAAAWNPEIGVAWDANGTTCEATVPLGSAGTLYVLATMNDLLAMDGAEFRVMGFPTEWPASVMPSPASSVSLGNPLGDGCNIAFPGHQHASASGVILLYTVTFQATSMVTERVLAITGHLHPSNPAVTCPYLTLDNVAFMTICAASHPGAINFPGFCPPLAVEPATWSRVRGMYR